VFETRYVYILLPLRLGWFLKSLTIMGQEVILVIRNALVLPNRLCGADALAQSYV
jgi:hypothetical protein